MLKIKTKNFVCTAPDNESGFTFISMLMTITVIIISLPLLIHALNLTDYNSNYDELSLHQFTYFLRDEIGMATDLDVKENILHLTSVDERNISFKKYDDQIIRQVNKKGYDVFARNISSVIFTKLNYGVRIKITSLKGAVYEKTIAFPM